VAQHQIGQPNFRPQPQRLTGLGLGIGVDQQHAPAGNG
jgi:hypothetical protein